MALNVKPLYMTKLFVFLSLVATLVACGDNSESGKRDNKIELISETDLHRDMKHRIDSMEQHIYADTFALDIKSVETLRETYDEFARRFPGDVSKSAEYLYKSAAISRGLGDPVQAIKTYTTILDKFGNYERAPEVQFLIAFTYDEDMAEKGLAREAYRDVMVEFPGDHWALQAEKRLETIDMSDEELMEFLLEKQKENPAQ